MKDDCYSMNSQRWDEVNDEGTYEDGVYIL